jgi:transposase-like protein
MTKEERRRYWKEIVEEQAGSGLDASVFCRKHNIKIPQFYRWRRKFQDINNERSLTQFVQLIPDISNQGSGIRIRFSANFFIEVDRSFDPLTLRTAVKALCSMD